MEIDSKIIADNVILRGIEKYLNEKKLLTSDQKILKIKIEFAPVQDSSLLLLQQKQKDFLETDFRTLHKLGAKVLNSLNFRRIETMKDVLEIEVLQSLMNSSSYFGSGCFCQLENAFKEVGLSLVEKLKEARDKDSYDKLQKYNVILKALES